MRIFFIKLYIALSLTSAMWMFLCICQLTKCVQLKLIGKDSLMNYVNKLLFLFFFLTVWNDMWGKAAKLCWSKLINLGDVSVDTRTVNPQLSRSWKWQPCQIHTSKLHRSPNIYQHDVRHMVSEPAQTHDTYYKGNTTPPTYRPSSLPTLVPWDGLFLLWLPFSITFLFG